MKKLKKLVLFACVSMFVFSAGAFGQDAPPTEAPTAPATPTMETPKAEVPVVPATPVKEAPKDLFLKGDAKCTACHDEADDAGSSANSLHPSVLSIGKTRHGVTADGRTPTCTSCHGSSEKHLSHKGKDKPPKPDRIFSKGSSTPAATQNEGCLSCHQSSKRHLWSGSAHETNDVSCASCHNMHAAKDKVRDRLTQADVCYTCHKEQRAQVSRPSHHPIKEGKVICSDCHNPHGSAGPKLLVKDSVNQTCYECHMEKRGPFLHNHQPVTEDCSTCHNPHGSTAASLLKQRVPLLCQSCHNVSGHRTQFVQDLPNRAGSTGSGALGSMAGGCLNCHTNIHGSNSTTQSSTGGRFRR